MRTEIEFVALQALLAMEAANCLRLGVVAHQARIATQPQSASCVALDAVDHTARQTVALRDALEVY